MFRALAVLGAVSFIPVPTEEVLLVLASDMWTEAEKGTWVEERTQTPRGDPTPETRLVLPEHRHLFLQADVLLLQL